MAEKIEVPRLPPFPTEPYDVLIELSDGSVEVVKTMARGPVASLQTAINTLTHWPDEKIALVTGMKTQKQNR